MDKEKKTKLFLTMLISIIALLVVGIVYQFVCIKKMQRDIDSIKNSASQIVCEYENNPQTFTLKY
ncbi:MAG: hypothetical protein ACI4L7_03490 [Christensenellales bacterium]